MPAIVRNCGWVVTGRGRTERNLLVHFRFHLSSVHASTPSSSSSASSRASTNYPSTTCICIIYIHRPTTTHTRPSFTARRKQHVTAFYPRSCSTLHSRVEADPRRFILAVAGRVTRYRLDCLDCHGTGFSTGFARV